MSSRPLRAGIALLLLFVLSGFAGLIYQSIWAHYLGLTLGHAAYAQTLVLAIFMGGLAVGAWLVSRTTLRQSHLILAYAVVELVIGILGVVFHPVFEAYVEFSQQSVLPGLSSDAWARAYQWLSATLLIAPQSILLGATFPLLSAGYLRLAPGSGGEILGGLYFANSIGAALGALFTTFLLLPLYGMPGSVLTAGSINLAVGIGAWLVWRSIRELPQPIVSPPLQTENADTTAEWSRLARVLLVAVFITGATSFVYEIGWVRLLNQALGTTVHSFELMLAAFIFGLACGGLWVRRKTDRIQDAVQYVGYAQVFMGVAALLSLVAFTQAFRWVGWMVQSFSKTDEGYQLYVIGSAAVSLLVMFPAAFFAGMTLPLITLALLRGGGGEAVIGRVYASNTLGAIVGVFLTVHLLVPLIGVRLSVTLAALGDVALGLYLLRRVSPAAATRGYALAGALAIAAAVVSMVGGRLDPEIQSSGVFRHGMARLTADAEVVYIRDGKTATTTVNTNNAGRFATISTNGKPDAGLATSVDLPPTPDETTMVMAAALPLAIHPHPERVAIIGWGSGLTTHSMLGSSVPKSVETIEIERTMYEGASLFGARVARAYSDPRSSVHFDDARTYFATGGRKLDVIISEPSNPWVSGVASLFTLEFYRFVSRHLRDDGILVQWIHSYEMDDAIMATMVAALVEVFPAVEVYTSNHTDLLFVAGKRALPQADWSRLRAEPLGGELTRVGLANSAEFQVRRVGSERLLRAFVRVNHAPAHSDYFPTVSLDGPRARFRGATSDTLQAYMTTGMPVLEMLDGRLPSPASARIVDSPYHIATQRFAIASGVRDGLLAGHAPAELSREYPTYALHVESLARLSSGILRGEQLMLWSLAAANAAEATLGVFAEQDLRGVWIAPSWISDIHDQPQQVRDVLLAYGAAASREPRRMRESALAVLDGADEKLAMLCREHMLLVAQLGAWADGGGMPAVREIDARYGMDIVASDSLRSARALMLAWTDAPHPAKRERSSQ